jgi:homocysteine S-methyltransferase
MKLEYPVLIDGGLSNELEKRGCDLNHKLWSAKILMSNPDALIQTHLAYLKAGAQIIATASYQATIPGLLEMGYNKMDAKSLLLKSVNLAEIAIKQFKESGDTEAKPLIAASIGPYGAYLADGSEYRGNYGITDEQLRDFHLERIQILDNSKADILAFETIPSFQEAMVLSEILMNTQKPAWISFSCKDEKHINDGTDIRESAELFASHPNVFAIGINCTAPKYVSGLIKALKEKSGNKKIIVYPNSGEAYNADSKTWLGLSEPISFATMTKEWIDLGADIIGGCCRIGPEHIKSINNFLHKR